MSRFRFTLFSAVVLAASAAHAQTVIYRETFGRSSPAPDTLPDQDTLGNVIGDQFDWPIIRPLVDGEVAVRQTAPSGASGVSGNAASGQPIDLANVNAGPNADGTMDGLRAGHLLHIAT